jgi:hypothetical protein
MPLTDEPEIYELRLVVSATLYDRLGSLADFLGIDDLGDLAAHLLAQAPELQPPRRVQAGGRVFTRAEARRARRR